MARMPAYFQADERVLFRKDTQDPLEEVGVDGYENNSGPGDGGGWRLEENWLLEYATRFATSHGYEIDELFTSEFLGHVRSRNVEEDGRYSEAEAIEAVKKIVTAAIEHSPGTTMLTAESFLISLSDLCPVWPFCR
ncbi:MAG TPA: hypothetical protein VHS13_00525 [Edaphobacter sp.]|jgi:hypothetical protein|nr:hypothetical protein [Edaphobacter sp.]